MGHISRQHVRVFAFFSLAFLMTGYAYAFNLLGRPLATLAATMAAFLFTGQLFREVLERG